MRYFLNKEQQQYLGIIIPAWTCIKHGTEPTQPCRRPCPGAGLAFLFESCHIHSFLCSFVKITGLSWQKLAEESFKLEEAADLQFNRFQLVHCDNLPGAGKHDISVWSGLRLHEFQELSDDPRSIEALCSPIYYPRTVYIQRKRGSLISVVKFEVV